MRKALIALILSIYFIVCAVIGTSPVFEDPAAQPTTTTQVAYVVPTQPTIVIPAASPSVAPTISQIDMTTTPIVISPATTMQEPDETTTEEPSAVIVTTTQEIMVWIPDTGNKYHTNAECSNMINPSYVTIDQAKSWGYGACKKCY